MFGYVYVISPFEPTFSFTTNIVATEMKSVLTDSRVYVPIYLTYGN